MRPSSSITFGLSREGLLILSVITGGGKWVEIEVPADPLYQHLIVTAERKFWRCVESGEPPTLFFGVEPPKPRIRRVFVLTQNGYVLRLGGVRRRDSGRSCAMRTNSMSGPRLSSSP